MVHCGASPRPPATPPTMAPMGTEEDDAVEELSGPAGAGLGSGGRGWQGSEPFEEQGLSPVSASEHTAAFRSPGTVPHKATLPDRPRRFSTGKALAFAQPAGTVPVSRLSSSCKVCSSRKALVLPHAGGSVPDSTLERSESAVRLGKVAGPPQPAGRPPEKPWPERSMPSNRLLEKQKGG